MTIRRAATESRKTKPRFVLCIKNDGYSVSLEKGKVYRVLPDSKASAHKMLRIVDESGEDYLYPADFFVSITLPQRARVALAIAA
ncbi:MAG: hypothetical protein AAB217_16685 [Chloroflexota bacterium]